KYGKVIELPDGLKFAYMTWPKGNPESAVFECGHCGCNIEEDHKAWMMEEGSKFENDGWVATAPSKGHAGFHIWAAYSLFPNAAWGKLAAEFIEAKASNDNQALQVFVNTVLGEDWEDVGERVDETALEKRREDYDGIAPRDVIVITAGVDIQGNRIEVEKVGWALNNESWGLGKTVIYGDPTGPDIWDELEDVLDELVPHELGFNMPVSAACVDSGFLTQTVQIWCQQRWSKRYWAIKGIGGPGRSIWPKKSAKTKGKLTQFSIGVDAAKELIYSRLRLTNHGAGYCHFNMTYDRDHFEQLTAEEVVLKYQKGLPVRHWQVKDGGNKRNEALDIRVYALAALEGMKVSGLSMPRRQAAVNKKAGNVPVPPDQPTTPVDHPPAKTAIKKKRNRRRVGRSSLMRSR
ncbi:MAG: terminase gpA endonuclease subunit, partial [Sneathiella sp.]